jgi:hypothetical protein
MAPDDQPTAMATLRKRIVSASEHREMVFLEAYHWTPREYRSGVEAYYRYLLVSHGFHYLYIPDVDRFPGWWQMIEDYAAVGFEATQQDERIRLTTDTLKVRDNLARYRIVGDEDLEFYLVPSKSGWRCAPELAYKDPDAYYEYYNRLAELFTQLDRMVSPQVQDDTEGIIDIMNEILELIPRKEFVQRQKNHDAIVALLEASPEVSQ